MAVVLISLGYFLIWPVLILLINSFNAANDWFVEPRRWGINHWINAFHLLSFASIAALTSKKPFKSSIIGIGPAGSGLSIDLRLHSVVCASGLCERRVLHLEENCEASARFTHNEPVVELNQLIGALAPFFL